MSMTVSLKYVDWNSLLNQGKGFQKDTKYHRFTLEQLLSKQIYKHIVSKI